MAKKNIDAYIHIYKEFHPTCPTCNWYTMGVDEDGKSIEDEIEAWKMCQKHNESEEHKLKVSQLKK